MPCRWSAIALGGGHEPQRGRLVRCRVGSRRRGIGQVPVRLGDENGEEGVPVRKIVVKPLDRHAQAAGDTPQGQACGPCSAIRRSRPVFMGLLERPPARGRTPDGGPAPGRPSDDVGHTLVILLKRSN